MDTTTKNLLQALANLNLKVTTDQGEVKIGAGNAAWFKETAQRLLDQDSHQKN